MPECVLVIEFDALIRSLLMEWLEELGLRVLTVGSLDALPATAVQLILLDLVNLRRASGRIVERVRSKYPGVPILGLSTQATHLVSADSRAALALGVDMLLPKPCDRQTLSTAVRSLLGLH